MANINTFIGKDAGGANQVGTANVFIGFAAGKVSTASNNTFVGTDAGSSNTTGVNNTFLGMGAGTLNIDGFSNTFVGQGAGDANTSADNNTFVGKDAGGINTTGFSNTFIGQGAGDLNLDADNNTFIGRDAGGANISGGSNTFVGQGAGDLCTASNNTFLGVNAGGGITTGSGNTFVGIGAGDGASSQTNHTCLGRNSDVSSADNGTAIGYLANCNGSNKVRIGNTSVTVIEGQVDFTFPSDARFKFNIHDNNVPGLSMINGLRPVTYQFDTRKFDEHVMQLLPDSTRIERMEGNNYEQSSSRIMTGFLAQEVELVCNDLGYTFSGLHIPESEVDNYGIAYGSFVPILVKGMQEQQAEIESLQTTVSMLVARLETLTAMNENTQHDK